MNFKFTFLRMLALVLTTQEMMETAVASGSSLEEVEQKYQKIIIRSEIDKNYSIVWGEEKKQRIQQQTLDFFNNCPYFTSDALKYPFKVFSNCSEKEAQDLIEMISILFKAEYYEYKGCLLKADFLKSIAKVAPLKRKFAYPQLLKVARHFEEQIFLFNEICSEFLKLESFRYEGMANLLIRLGETRKDFDKNTLVFDAYKGIEIIESFKNIPLETQSQFSAFLEANQVKNIECAQQLAQVSPQEWEIILRKWRR